MEQKINQKLSATAGLIANPSVDQSIGFHNIYKVECFDADGNLKWEEENPNLVTTLGLHHVLDVIFFSGAASANWYCGLGDASLDTGAVVGDTMASHAGWGEVTGEANAPNRQLITWNTLGATDTSITNSTGKAVFSTFTGNFTVGGAFISNNDGVASNTAGLLYGVAGFTFGDRPISPDDTINVTVSITLANPA